MPSETCGAAEPVCGNGTPGGRQRGRDTWSHSCAALPQRSFGHRPGTTFGTTATLMFFPVLVEEIVDSRPWDPILGAAVIVAVALVPLAVKIGNGIQRRRTERLREQFGDDYDRVVTEHGDWREAERVLMRRLKTRGRDRAR